MNEKTIKRLQALPRVSIENGITYYIIPQEEYEKLKDKEQEIEEIKKYLGISSKTIMQRLQELQEFKDKLKISEYNYKQALDEIVETAKEIADTKEWVNCTYNALKAKQILDIINKAKDGE